VTAPRRCDLFSASQPLPLRFFPSLRPRPLQPSRPQTQDGGHCQLWGDPAQTPAAPGLLLLFSFYSCLRALLLTAAKEQDCFQGHRVLVVSVLFAGWGGPSSQDPGPWMLVAPRVGMHRVLSCNGTSSGAAGGAVDTTGIWADTNSKPAHNNQVQVGWGSEQPGLFKDVPAHCSGRLG